MPISDDPRRFEPGSVLAHERVGSLVVRSARRHRGRLLVAFEGVEDRTEAAGLAGALYVGAGALRSLGEHEFWAHEVVGCEVTDPAGNRIGRVSDVVPGAAHDLLNIATPAGERLVPAVRAIVVEVDVTGRRIVIDAPEGLLDR